MASGDRTRKYMKKGPLKVHDPHKLVERLGGKTEKTVMPACWGQSGSVDMLGKNYERK